MQVSFEWLREYVDVDISAGSLAEKLTMAGIEVAEIEDQAAQYQGIVIAKVLNLEQHPQADNLLVTKVNAGEAGVKTVITAAKNLKTGDLVPLALPGTVLPTGKIIEEVNFKGVVSQGMLCSGAELGLEKESTGIWVFFTKEQLKPGTLAAQALGATDQVLVLELTANRADCLGMIGVAREVAAILAKKLTVKPVVLKEAGPPIESLAKVEICDADLCPRYAARVVLDVNIAPSPEWMQNRLKAAGVRPINNIVDITNYVMLEYNQPLHAFDLDRISGHHIKVRRAKGGEQFATLDEIARTFTGDNLLIADPEGGLCVAGVMGGCTSEVTDKTVNILLEAAYFNPISIRKTARQLGMKTEASLRFERGIDPNGVVLALNRAAQLIEELGAGKVAKGNLDQYPLPVPALKILTNPKRINGLLGTDLTMDEIKKYLERVTFEVKTAAANLEVTIPTYRQDVTHMADLAEEVARLYGYNKIPVTIPDSKQMGEQTPFQKLQCKCRSLLTGVGLSEVMTYSLYAKNTADRLGIPKTDPLNNTVDLMVPLSEEQAVMRTNLVHHLLEVLAFNAKRHQPDFGIFEIARVYWPRENSLLPEEALHLGVGLMGRQREFGWNQSRDEADFYDIKGILELLLMKFNLTEFDIRPSNRPFLHPGQAAEVYSHHQLLGFLGQVHPTVQNKYELTKRVFIMELDLSVLNTICSNENISFEPLPKFPAVQRDLALVVSIDITAQSIISSIKQLSGDLVEKVDLFDVYQGEQVAKGQRSLAFSITYRSKERTLSDTDVNQLQDKLLGQLQQEYGAVVRA